jgi:2'-5' RNA ligase
VSADGSPDTEDRSLRLFVALELPAPVRAAVGNRTAAELGPIDVLRPVRSAGLHVTLCFLGATAGGQVDAIAARCRDACAGHGPLRLSLGELVVLAPQRPRVITRRVVDEHGSRLAALQGELSRALTSGGWYRPESRPFLAHVTVARVRSRARLNARALDAVRERDRVPGANRERAVFTADVVTLFQSRTQPGGTVHEPLVRIALAARATS